jgi:glycosyltransferase involved in cell wall biosynthesis
VLPVYNGERYLRAAIDSILAQSYSRFELIAVDDGSTDAGPMILEQYARRDARVRVIRQPNSKLPAALSNGFRAAEGEFLTWTSDDNRLKPDFLRRLVDCLSRHPDWDMVYANQELIGEDGEPLLSSERYPLCQSPYGGNRLLLPHDTARLNGGADNFVGATFLYRARVAMLLGDYATHLFGLEDYDYWMRVNALMTLRHADFDESLCEYRYHGGSLTSRAAELEIERRRRELVRLDERRREAFTRPLRWVVESDDDDACRQMRKGITNSLATATELPGQPVEVHARIVRDADRAGSSATRPDRHALAVLVVLEDSNLPSEVPAEWDLCAARSDVAEPPAMRDRRRGWLTGRDAAALAAAIDIRARSRQLERMEQSRTGPIA